MSGLQGIFPAIVTPFSRGGKEIDFGWIPLHLAFLSEGGVNGVVPLGTNGEAASISLSEKKQVLETVIANKQKLKVIAGTGCSALPETIELSNYALEKGADAIMIVPPFYFKEVEGPGLLNYYRAVFASLPAGARVFLYNIPNLSGVEIRDELVDGLLETHADKLAGIKDTSGKLENTRHYIARYPQLSIFGGSDTLIGPSLATGCVGSISAMANVFPKEVSLIYQSFVSNAPEFETAQNRMAAIRQAVKRFPPYGAIKYLLSSRVGLPETFVRPPLTDLTEEERIGLDTALKDLGVN